MPRGLWIVVGCLTATVGLVGAYPYAPAFGLPSSKALNHSLTRDVGGWEAEIADCRITRGQIWACEVWDDEMSGLIDYRVTLEGDCWKARRISPGPGDPDLEAFAEGCVRLRDQLRLYERLMP